MVASTNPYLPYFIGSAAWRVRRGRPVLGRAGMQATLWA